jgi:hypothetical protein
LVPVVTGLLIAFPKELVLAIAGLALLGSIGGGLASALKDETHREAALITFLVTLSGVVIAGVGSAFWGVAAGVVALFVQSMGVVAAEAAAFFIADHQACRASNAEIAVHRRSAGILQHLQGLHLRHDA